MPEEEAGLFFSCFSSLFAALEETADRLTPLPLFRSQTVSDAGLGGDLLSVEDFAKKKKTTTIYSRVVVQTFSLLGIKVAGM